MNKITFIAQQCRYLILVFLLCAFSSVDTYANLDESIEGRILSLGSSVDVRYSAEVKRRIKQYTVNQRKTSEILLGRSSIYFSTFENVFREKGLPQDLKYLAVIESGLRPHVTSRSGAAGLWQFMRPTGRMMGLEISRTIDERRDVEKSTKAAAEYLLKLYNSFDDWTLAIAAYNCGPGNLRKAIRKAGGKKDFWAIKKYLPKETREYVPKFIAMSYVMNYYYEHDLMPRMPEQDMLNTSQARVFEKIGFSALSKQVGTDINTIKRLNPSFIRNYIPQTEDGKYRLVLPTPDMRIVAAQYHVLAELPLLKKKEEVIEEVVQVARPDIEVVRINSWKIQSSDHNNGPSIVQSYRVHKVRLGEEEEGIKEEKPESYKINDRSKTINDIGHIIKNVKKTI